MNHPVQSLLAASDDGVVKLIFFVIAAIIWGIGAAASAMKKANAQGKTNSPPPLPPAQAPAPPPVPSPQRPQGLEWARMKIPNRPMSARPLTTVAVKPPPPPQQRKGKRSKSAQQAQKRQAPTPVAAPRGGLESSPATSPITAGLGEPLAVAPKVSPELSALRATLAAAPAMRRQMIVAELLNPPLALREDGH